MTTDRESAGKHQDCSACWDALVSSGRTGGSVDAVSTGHLDTCPSCRDSAARAERLGVALETLADQIDAEARSQAPNLADDRTVDLLIRLARYEAWHRWARRGCAAGVGIAASLALIWSVMWAFGVGSDRPAIGPPGMSQPGLAADGAHSPGRKDPLDSAVASAIPVHGWVDLPSKAASADSSVWWVVLSYGGPR